MEIRLGDYNRLTVCKSVDFGMYLDGGDEGEILLPRRYVPEGTAVGDEIDVFIYLDQDERPVATTERPVAKVGEFACLECSWVNGYGAFLDWGLMKDVFCPFREQKERMARGGRYVVHIHIDEESYRIMASAKVERYIDGGMPPYVQGQEVDMMVWQKTPLGFKVIIDNRYAGLVYANRTFRSLQAGDRMKGYIDLVREDGKIDVSLQPAGRIQTELFSDTLLDYLHGHGGTCDLGDKSDAGEIRRRFQVSKKVFKKAVGELYRRRLITVGDRGIRLV